LQLVAEAGQRAIRAKSERQTAKIIALADHRGWPVRAPRDPARRGGTVAVEMPNSKDVCAGLLKRDVLVDWRPQAGVRMSPHFYTSDDEIETAFAAIDEIVAKMGAAVAR
jgi:kynureninase